MKLSTLLLATLVVLPLVVESAPSSTRHSRVLTVNQSVFENGTAVQTAAIVVPTNQSQNQANNLMVSSLGGIEIPSGQANTLFRVAPRFDYARFWTALRAVNACQVSLSSQYRTWFDSYVASYTSGAGRPGFNYYYDPGKISPFDVANNQMGASTYVPPPFPFNTFSLLACPYNPSEYGIAVLARQNVANYQQDSLEAIQFVTAYHLVTNNAAAALKQDVITFLNNQGLESAWIDLHFDILEETTGVRKRVASSFQIQRTDTPTTPGQYISSVLRLPPGSPTVQEQRDNHVNITYVSYGQYPDIFHRGNDTNANFLTSNYPTPVGLGVLSWSTNVNTSPVNSSICVGATSCSAGGVFGQLQTNGEYDNPFALDSAGVPTVSDPEALNRTTGPECLIGGGINCRVTTHTASSILGLTNSATGTLTYYGRWELDFDPDITNPGNDKAFPPRAEVRETLRRMIYNVCQDMEFQNSIDVQYRVRRLVREYDLRYTGAGVAATLRPSGVVWEVTNILLPVATQYTTLPNFMVPRQNSPTVNLDSSVMFNRLFTDPVGGLGIPVNEGAVMVDPLIPRELFSATLYRGITMPAVPADQTWNDKVVTRLPTTVLSSDSLPTTHQSTSVSTARTAHFNCIARNEPTYYSYFSQQNPYNEGWGPYYPSGYVPGSVSITPGNNDGDPCQLEFRRWTTGSYTTQMLCTLPPVETPPSSGIYICPGTIAEFWTWTAGPIETISLAPACTETCEIGGSVQVCPRPY